MKNFLLSTVLLLVTVLSYGQTRIAIYDIDLNENRSTFVDYSSSWLSNIPDYLINFYANDDRFIVIDRKNDQLIKNEKERQKSEEFIDGYIVEQGREEGIDYIVRSWLTEKGKQLNVRFYDVKNETVLCEKSIALSKFFTVVTKLQITVEELAHEANLSCFNLNFEVVRSLEDKKEKVKELLVLAGHSRNVTKGDLFLIFEIVEEEIGGKIYTRENILGEGVISKIQDQNFSEVKVKKGGDVIYERLQAKVPIYCKYEF